MFFIKNCCWSTLVPKQAKQKSSADTLGTMWYKWKYYQNLALWYSSVYFFPHLLKRLNEHEVNLLANNHNVCHWISLGTALPNKKPELILPFSHKTLSLLYISIFLKHEHCIHISLQNTYHTVIKLQYLLEAVNVNDSWSSIKILETRWGTKLHAKLFYPREAKAEWTC